MSYLLGWLAGQRTSYSTSFAATENPISEGGIWLNGLTDGLDWNDMKTASGLAYCPVFPTGFHDGLAQLKRSFLACTSNQFSEGVIHVSAPGGDGNEIELFVNMTIAAHSVTGYECYLNLSGAHTLVRWNGAYADFTPLATNNISNFTAPTNGDVIRIQRSGAVIGCYQNGVLRTEWTDSTYTNGNPGIGNNPYDNVGTTLGANAWESWTGGNL